MGGIDRLISETLSIEIKKKMDIDLLKKVERELFLDHGMSIKFSIEHFQKFTSILKKNQILISKNLKKTVLTKLLK